MGSFLQHAHGGGNVVYNSTFQYSRWKTITSVTRVLQGTGGQDTQFVGPFSRIGMQ